MSQLRVSSSPSSSSSSPTYNHSNSSDFKLFAAIGGSILASGLAISYYYNKKLQKQQQEFEAKLELLKQQQQGNQGRRNSLLQSNQFSAKIAPGPVPSLQLSSPLFQPSSSSVHSSPLLSSINNAVNASPRLMGRTPNAVVVVDPVSTGANIAYEVTRRGVPCIRVMSGYVSPTLLNLVDESVRTEFVASINHDSADPYKTVVSLAALPFNIIGIISGSELGVEVTDFLTEQLGVPSNGTEMTNARRDKYQMGEAVRRAGVRAVKQARVQSWPELEAFIQDLRPNPFKLVLKPIRSAGSDNVYLCESASEAKSHFEHIIGHQNQLGFQNEAVVAQEFLQGIEYVVDGVSRDGKHKIIAIWEYDKRNFNGFNFVYFGMGSVSGKSPIGAALADYMVKVLDALNIIHGASHGEVIMTKDGPCLVEVGSRAHGCEGTFMPLANRIWGYNQVGALVSATLSKEEFDALPDVCGDEKEYGFKVDFVSNREGKLLEMKHLDDMKALPSFMKFDVLPKIGDDIHITIDCFTAVGSVTLCHKSRKQVEEDHQKIREWEKNMFIVEHNNNEQEAKQNGDFNHNNTNSKKSKPKRAGP